jgi:hypothetical protein
LRAADAEYFEEAGVFLRESFFVLVPDDRVCWPARVSDGRPRATRVARRHRARGRRVGRFGITGSNSLDDSWLQRGIGILANKD